MNQAASEHWPELTAGTNVAGRYVLEETIGQGGMGSVWRARHTVTGKHVAVKALGLNRDEITQRFIREAQVLATVRHKNLIDVHDVLTLDDGRPVMVMDLLEGATLAERLDEEGVLSVQTMAELMLPVVEAIAEAHLHGIVHRDIKPENIFLDRHPQDGLVPKVLDFGIAKVTASLDHSGNITKTGSVLGTPTYMAPEQVYGEKDIDARADIWSLGMVIYECLTGSCPTEADNVGQVFKAIVCHDFPPLEQVRSDVPAPLAAMVGAMTSASRRSRPELSEVSAVLGALAEGRVPPSFAPPPTSLSPEGESPRSVVSSSGEASVRSERLASADTILSSTSPNRSPLVLAGIAVGVVLAVVGLSAWVTSGGQPPARVTGGGEERGAASVSEPGAPVATPDDAKPTDEGSVAETADVAAPPPSAPLKAQRDRPSDPPAQTGAKKVAGWKSKPPAPAKTPTPSLAQPPAAPPASSPPSPRSNGGVYEVNPY